MIQSHFNQLRQCCLLLSCVLLCAASASAKVKIGDLYYELDEAFKTAKVTCEFLPDSENTNYADLTELNIPTSVLYQDENYVVTDIDDNTFKGCVNLTGQLVIPETIVTIGNFAFEGCSGLTGNLIIPELVYWIGVDAFSGCSGFDGKLELPKEITVIDGGTFRGCTGLTSNLTIPNGVTQIGMYAFDNCKGLTGDLIIPESVTEIGPWAFYGCGFDGKLELPKNITRIEEYAFAQCCALNGNLVIPETVNYIGAYAFWSCFGLSGELIIPKSVTEIGRSAFSNCRGFTGKLELPEGITKIETAAFSGCVSLTGELVIPESVTEIGDNAFSSCWGFTGDLVIPESVTKIGSVAFYDCRGFTGKLELPKGITKIGPLTFSRCIGLTGDLVIPESVTEIGRSAFWGVNMTPVICKSVNPPHLEDSSVFSSTMLDDANLIVPEESLSAYKEAAGWKNFVNWGILESAITLNKESAEMCVGEKLTLSATVEPADATYKSVTWTSSDETVATVDENGAVTAIKAGSVIITATTANGLTATCEVIVSAESGITKIIVDSKVTVRVENSIIKVSDAKIGELCNIYQADGRLLQSFKISGAIVETRPMPSGIYIVIVDDTIRKIIVR